MAVEAVEPNSESDEEERWLVMMAPGEVRSVTLEQLDDFFRLDVIDASTRVCGPDMDDWVPLGVIAGIEAEEAIAPEPEPVQTLQKAPPPPSTRPPAVPSRPPANMHESGVTSVSPQSPGPGPSGAPASSRGAVPPAPTLRPTAAATVPPGVGPYGTTVSPTALDPFNAPTMESAVTPSSRTPAAAPTLDPFGSPASAPAPPSPSSFSPASAPPPLSAAPTPSPAASGTAVALPWGPAPVPSATTVPPQANLPETLRPLAGDIAVPQTMEPRGSAPMWIVAVAAIAGLVLVLYRNGVVHDIATAAGQESSYSQMESALGAPGFGTQRSIEELRATFEEARKVDAQRAVFHSKPLETDTSSRDSDPDDSTSASAEKSTSATSSGSGSDSSKKEESTAEKKSGSASSLSAAASRSSVKSSSAKQAKRRAVRRAPRRAPPPSRPAPKEEQKKMPAGYEYDPLNGNL